MENKLEFDVSKLEEAMSATTRFAKRLGSNLFWGI
jgi:hypothetical protein